MTTHRIEIAITDEALDAARSEYPSTMPSGSPAEWNEANLRNAINVLSSLRWTGFKIVCGDCDGTGKTPLESPGRTFYGEGATGTCRTCGGTGRKP